MAEDLVDIQEDRPFMVIDSGYLKMPDNFKKEFGIGTGSKLGPNFPNPVTGVKQSETKVQIVYEFEIEDLKKWRNEKDIAKSNK